MKLTLVPITLSDAAEFVRRHHRHHRPSVSGLFAVACSTITPTVEVLLVDGCVAHIRIEPPRIVGVAVVGRPVARGLQDGFTAEVTRVATLKRRNACSMLYGAAWRAARALGYRRLVTYTLASEPGTSLRAAGWKTVGEVKGRSWHCLSRPRIDRHPTQNKIRWEASV